MRPLVRSYGVSSTSTSSPVRTRIRFLRILPAVWPRISWPFSSSTRNMALGSSSTTRPRISRSSSLAIHVLCGKQIARRLNARSSNVKRGGDRSPPRRLGSVVRLHARRRSATRGQGREQKQGDDVGDLDHRVDGRSGGVLVGVADGVAGDRRLVRLRSLAAV